MKNINEGTYEEIKTQIQDELGRYKNYKSQGNTLRGDTINEKRMVEITEG